MKRIKRLGQEGAPASHELDAADAAFNELELADAVVDVSLVVHNVLIGIVRKELTTKCLKTKEIDALRDDIQTTLLYDIAIAIQDAMELEIKHIWKIDIYLRRSFLGILVYRRGCISQHGGAINIPHF
jgi:hypothetical protein